MIHSDRRLLTQVLTNLLSNAIKFTDRGSVCLSVRAEDQGLRFDVTDSGIGIPADQIGRLFNAFQQLDAETTRKYGGSGLGLAISRKLVDCWAARSNRQHARPRQPLLGAAAGNRGGASTPTGARYAATGEHRRHGGRARHTDSGRRRRWPAGADRHPPDRDAGLRRTGGGQRRKSARTDRAEHPAGCSARPRTARDLGSSKCCAE
jgi:hypothetical protein